MKIVQSLKESGLLRKGTSAAIKNEAKKQGGGFIRKFFGTLRTSLLENTLAGKVVILAGERVTVTNQGHGKIRAEQHR